MKATIEMPDVTECEAAGCAYNVERRCHARAITIGDGVHPACDTFLPNDQHVRGETPLAGVGACKVDACRHNTDFECQAESIRVRRHEQHADCATFERS